MKRAFYATIDVAGYKKYQVVLLTNDDETHAGLMRTGYFEEIATPARGPVVRPDRAR